MGPLAGQGLISPEFDYILALLIGIAFGFVLEQSGFSSAKRLAGLFYGREFVVLRVFFTAAITTVIGVILMEHFGMLDMNLVYIQPTFTWSAIVGGVIMGIGFLFGGFCPGTSLCAVSIGKIDAIFFFGGLFIGVFLFAEMYPIFEPLYHAQDLGGIFVFDSLGMSRGLFAALLIVMAVMAFVVTYFIEQYILKKPKQFNLAFIKSKPYHVAAIAVAMVFALIVGITPTRSQKIMAQAQECQQKSDFSYMSSVELAYKLLNPDNQTLYIDIRNADDFVKLALPKTVNIPFASITNREWEDFLGDATKKKVLIAHTEEQAQQAACVMQQLGYKHIQLLRGGFSEFEATIIKQHIPTTGMSDTEKTYIKKAHTEILQLIERNKKPILEKKVLTKAKGGC
ncbi:MAG: molybdopterin biosynthesis protein MoeB [Bacteroidetes bacterium ADurb.Bin217]|nr:MAG: molybdopterin biosynthesis protein MoeB [Bacteroidetes bacterium ADurb.Bin217]